MAKLAMRDPYTTANPRSVTEADVLALLATAQHGAGPFAVPPLRAASRL